MVGIVSSLNQSSDDFWRPSGSVPKTNDLNQMPRIVEAVHNAIRAHNDLANELILKLGHDTPQFRRFREKAGSRNKKQPELKSAVRASKEM